MLKLVGDESLRSLFRRSNRLMLLLWRLGLGPYLSSDAGGHIMVLITRGHRSGLRRQAPVNFARDDGVVYCIAGFGPRTHWYRNLLAAPACEVWLPDGWWAGTAEAVADPDERLAILRRVLIRSGFAAPLFEGIYPAALSDEELRRLAERYEVVRIRLDARRSGPGGPGDLAWVWPLLGVAAAVALACRVLRRRCCR